MSVTRRLVLFACLLVPAVAVAEEAPLPYVTPKQVDLTRLLPPPPAAGSPAERADRAAAVAVQKGASPERVALAVHDTDETVYAIFGSVMGERFEATKLPLTDRLFARLGAGEDDTVDPAKPFFGRVRPWLAMPDEIKPLVKSSKSGSWPSGHTTRATLEGIVLAAMMPEKKTEIWARVGEYAESRVVGGMHYPKDVEAGRLAGTAMATAAFLDPAFVADFEAAEAELRAAYGL